MDNASTMRGRETRPQAKYEAFCAHGCTLAAAHHKNNRTEYCWDATRMSTVLRVASALACCSRASIAAGPTPRCLKRLMPPSRASISWRWTTRCFEGRYGSAAGGDRESYTATYEGPHRKTSMLEALTEAHLALA